LLNVSKGTNDTTIGGENLEIKVHDSINYYFCWQGKSCTTSSCWIPPGSEGSKGRRL